MSAQQRLRDDSEINRFITGWALTDPHIQRAGSVELEGSDNGNNTPSLGEGEDLKCKNMFPKQREQSMTGEQPNKAAELL